MAFVHAGPDLGWHAHVVGEDGCVLLSFPWIDRVDEMLTGARPCELPVEVPPEGWDDLDQGWWGRIIVDGLDLYLAETDFDAMTHVRDSNRIEYPQAGIVLVDGVEVRWNSVSKSSYQGAWRQAIEACRKGTPSPVAQWQGEDRLVVRN